MGCRRRVVSVFTQRRDNDAVHRAGLVRHGARETAARVAAPFDETLQVM
jgi:hypothetical protein